MSNPYETNQHKHKLRFYIVIATLIILGSFLLFTMNKDPSGITGAITGLSGSSSTDSQVIDTGNKEIEFSLSFDQLPQSEKDIKVNNIKIKFNDLNNKISINGDEVELNNMQDIALDISGFNGQINFEKSGISLDGISKRIEVNGVALSSPKDKLKISFDNLKYQFLELEGIQLEDLTLPTGTGNMEVNKKMTYVLENEKISIDSFQGNLAISEGTFIQGTSTGLRLSGNNLNLVLN